MTKILLTDANVPTESSRLELAAKDEGMLCRRHEGNVFAAMSMCVDLNN
jgi:hypothetical protein